MRMTISAILFTWMAVETAVAGCMDTDNQYWKSADTATFDKLMGLMACPLDADSLSAPQIDHVACNYFVGKAIQLLYTVDDFTPARNGKWLTADEIVMYVKAHHESWSRLGPASDQKVLADAAQGAANGQPVIATMTGDPHGHIALILGGKLEQSTTWKKNVPNSAAFSLNNVQKAYVFCRLSAAFSDPSNVEIYWRDKK
jgi:hypothetical protein